jgi:uncharacterized heparinase superfamily protein
LLLEGVDQKTYDMTADSLAEQLLHLTATWRDAPDGQPRLQAITALVYGDLCIAGHERHLAEVEMLLSAELKRQIMVDGGHISRNPGVLVDVLLDLLPLRQCFVVRERQVPVELEATIGRILPMLRFMRLGDGTLARFNGMGAPSIDELATVLGYGAVSAATRASAPQSGYVRLERGGIVVIVDAGSPPPIELAGDAHAGCLSFEMSAGVAPLFVNGGAPGPAQQDWRAASRSTASHNTLVLGGQSSSRLVRHPLLESLIGGSPIRYPDSVKIAVGEGEEGVLFDAQHDGYVRQFGLVHHRKLALAANGTRVIGVDRLVPPQGTLRLKQDVPFAIHFHAHPTVRCEPTEEGAAIIARTGERWRLSATGAALSIEPSVHYADLSGPTDSRQVMLRGVTYGETEVRWRLERVTDGDGAV